jgi:hypothetical protein
MGSLHIGVIGFRMDTVNPIVQIGAIPTRVGATGVTAKDDWLQVRTVVRLRDAFQGTSTSDHEWILDWNFGEVQSGLFFVRAGGCRRSSASMRSTSAFAIARSNDQGDAVGRQSWKE